MENLSQNENQIDKWEVCARDCLACYQACVRCLSHCMSHGGDHAEKKHLSILIECAEICQLTSKVLMLGNHEALEFCRTCSMICRACAKACRSLGDDSELEGCAFHCLGCADSCDSVSENLSGESFS